LSTLLGRQNEQTVGMQGVAVMNVEVNKTDKGNYGWLDLQRMNLPFTTMGRYVTESSRESSLTKTRIDAGTGARQASAVNGLSGCLTRLLFTK
jgi:hypothetical protein